MLNSYFKSQDKNFYLLHGDSMKLLNDFEHKFDMVFADPPYFLSNGSLSIQSGKIVSVDKGGWDKSLGYDFVNDFNRKWLKLVREKMKDDATIWISGTMHNIFSIGQILTELDFKILNVITWEKSNPPPNFSCRFFTHSTEQIIWARKKEKVPHYFNYELMKQLNGDKQMKDVWKLPAISPWEKSCTKHPTQKPLSVLTRLILASTKPNAWILDPFTGSSTTGIAANLANRRFLGIDQEKDFLEISKKRKLEIENPKTATLYKEKINGFNDKTEYSLFLNSEPEPEINVALSFYRSSALPEIENQNKFYFHAIEKNNVVNDFPVGILDAKILFIYSGGRSKTAHFTGYYANIKIIALKHKSKIKGKKDSKTEFYYEVELESNFKINKKINAELNPKLLFEDNTRENQKLFQQFLPAVTKLSNVLKANNMTSVI
jgi:site-specific DNA-methyltransferase (adenine-specific)